MAYIDMALRLNDFFNKIGILLDTIQQQGNPQRIVPLPEDVKELVRTRCNALLQRVGGAPVVSTAIYEEENNSSNPYYKYVEENAEDADEYGLSNELILKQFPTRESYNSYEQGPNDPLQPFLNNVNKNRIWRASTPRKTMKRPRSNIRSFMERKPHSIPNRPRKKGSFQNRNPLDGSRRSRR